MLGGRMVGFWLKAKERLPLGWVEEYYFTGREQQIALVGGWGMVGQEGSIAARLSAHMEWEIATTWE